MQNLVLNFQGSRHTWMEMQHRVQTRNVLYLKCLRFRGHEEDPLPQIAADDSERV